MKRGRTTSITRLRTVSDAAREGLITQTDKSTLKKLILCNDERADHAMEALNQNRVFELQEILTSLQTGIGSNNNSSRMRLGSLNGRAKTSSLDMGADASDLLWSALDDLDVDGALEQNEAWKQAGRSCSRMPPPARQPQPAHLNLSTSGMFSAAQQAAALAASVPPSPQKNKVASTSSVRRKSADFLDDLSGMRRSSLDMLTDVLMGDDFVDGLQPGNSEDFMNATANAAASIDPIPFRKMGGQGYSAPPVTRDNFKENPNYINYTGTSSTDSRAVSNEMINMLANGVVEDPSKAFPADSGNPYSHSVQSHQNNPVAPVAAQFLNKLNQQGVGAAGPSSNWRGVGVGANVDKGAASGRRRSSGSNKHKLVAIAPNKGEWTQDMPVAPPPMRKKQSTDVESMLLTYKPPSTFPADLLSVLDSLKGRVAERFMEGIIFQNECFMILHLAGMSNEFLLNQLKAAVEDRADGNSTKLNTLFATAAAFFQPDKGKMAPQPGKGGGGERGREDMDVGMGMGMGGGGDLKQKILMKKEAAVKLRNEGNLTSAMKLMKEVKELEKGL
ncbi:hypothetical protein TL16_g12064 [Triparma laevis f. inornata]|uniref:Uncharacterized protein n=1 Tax=Triparma laevis f. inornata TaxID=1714386 RepID=A0A9W7BHX7_9STRA|nr:hypothetical protein TL16_g12064 [Triparma laevis f. inornata]